MPLEEKDGRLFVKLTPKIANEFWEGDQSVGDLGEALETALSALEKEGKPQEILIVVDKGF